MSLPFSSKKQKLQFLNCIVNTHDIACDCYNPLYHSAKIILDQLKTELKPEEKYQLKQCLGEDPTTKEEDEDGYNIGDLEALFAEDGDKEEDAGTSG